MTAITDIATASQEAAGLKPDRPQGPPLDLDDAFLAKPYHAEHSARPLVDGTAPTGRASAEIFG